jgi:ribosomal protein L23
MNLKPIATEKAIMKVETENTLGFLVDEKTTKQEIKKEIEELFKVKVDKIRTNVRNNHNFSFAINKILF